MIANNMMWLRPEVSENSNEIVKIDYIVATVGFKNRSTLIMHQELHVPVKNTLFIISDLKENIK